MPLLFVLLWSTGFIGARYGLPHADALSFLTARYALVLLLMLPFALATRAPWPKDWRAAMHIGIAGLLVHATYLGGVFIAIGQGLPAGITALVVGLQPLLTAVGAGALLGERVTGRQWLGLACGIVGVALVLSGKLHGGATAGPGAMTAAVVALLGITAGTLYQKRFCPHFDLRSGAVLQFLPTAAVTALVVAGTGSWRVDWTGEFVFALGWLVVVLSFGAISLLNLLIRRGSAVSVASLFYLTPVVTAAMAWPLFGERLSAPQLAGMAIAVFGVWLARRG